MSITDVTQVQAYRDLAVQAVQMACDSAQIQVSTVKVGERSREAAYSWVCFIVDPNADDRVAPTTGSSAADHLALIDPNGILRETGSTITITIYEVEIADQASIQVKDADGNPTLTTPWLANLAVAKAMFNYWPS
jgi:hypothetical protein